MTTELMRLISTSLDGRPPQSDCFELWPDHSLPRLVRLLGMTSPSRLRKKSTFWKNGHETGSRREFRSNQINVLRRCKRGRIGLEAPPTDFFRSLLGATICSALMPDSRGSE